MHKVLATWKWANLATSARKLIVHMIEYIHHEFNRFDHVLLHLMSFKCAYLFYNLVKNVVISCIIGIAIWETDLELSSNFIVRVAQDSIGASHAAMNL